METEEKRNLLAEFLGRWPESVVKSMTLPDYVGVNDKDTFTYWVETKMKSLGSSKGWDSLKFGIYRRSDKLKRRKHYQNDNEYSWMTRYGTTRTEAFSAVKQEIVDIIRFAEIGNFAEIDTLQLPDLFKWKVASLYSNERLVPIFRRETLLAIASAYGLDTNPEPTVSEIQELLISTKPIDQDIYSYMDELYERFGRSEDEEQPSPVAKVALPKGTASRKPTDSKNTASQTRRGARSYIATQKHNKLQEVLRQKLIKQHGPEAVFMEENYVDVKLVLRNEIVFYEVKSASYASDCIGEALGQLLGYVFQDKDTRRKKIVVVGQYPPNVSDKKFIEHVKSLLRIDFDYENVEL